MKIKKLNPKFKSVAIILAGGKGKRIKSEIPKVLHSLWGIPSVVRVCDAAEKGLGSPNRVVVVGMKAQEVMNLVGSQPTTIFAYQKIQKGTGHALQVAVSKIKNMPDATNVYVFPGDTGLLDPLVVKKFKSEFEKSSSAAMMLTGQYEGPIELNMYGRIVRIPSVDGRGERSGGDYLKVAEIVQAKDVLKMQNSDVHKVVYNKKIYNFTKQQLRETREFDSGFFAFRLGLLKKYLRALRSNNVQHELYMTDMVKILNDSGYKVESYSIKNDSKDLGYQPGYSLLGFNSRSELKKMESILRAKYFELLKDVLAIDNEEDFFIDSEVIKQILRLDRTGLPVDITIGEGCSISKNVKINRGVTIGKRAVLDGNVIIGKRVKIGENVQLSTYPGQKLIIGDDTKILNSNIIKGNVKIGKNVEVETGVIITGSNEYPVVIGDNCILKGTTYIFGSIIEPGNWVQHSVLVKKYVQRLRNKSKEAQKVRYILPHPEGRDSIVSITQRNNKKS